MTSVARASARDHRLALWLPVRPRLRSRRTAPFSVRRDRDPARRARSLPGAGRLLVDASGAMPSHGVGGRSASGTARPRGRRSGEEEGAMKQRMRVALVVGIVFGALRLGATAMAHPPADDLEPITGVDAQPLIAQARRIADALDFVGSPLEPAEKSALEAAFELPAEEAVAAIQRVFAPRVLIDVHINPESRVKVARGPAPPRLIQLGWRTFLVRGHTEPGV